MTKLDSADLNQIAEQLVKQNNYIQYVYSQLQKQIEKIKQEIIEEFENHPVTQEINGGIAASNISNTLDGVTNLYSFIGFESGDNPLNPIREELKKINLKHTTNSKGELVFSVEFPTAKDIFKVTPMPWATGRSWSQGIELGISGLGYYIKKTKNSRSGLGIQSQTPIRNGVRFKNTKYISYLINSYTKKIQDLSKDTIL
jgi:hypothetical protein